MASSDVFRPRLPLDPFHDTLPPWLSDLDPDADPHTVLVLGAPSHADLAPLLLAPALVIIATHTPPPVPETWRCPVVILRLPSPLDIHDAGAVRLVSLLDRAQRVAHTWHAAPHAQPRIQQLAELYPGGEFAIAEPPEFALPSDHAPQPPTPGPRPDRSETSSLSSTVSSSSSSSSLLARTPSTPSKAQYTFSALVNFLPAMLPDKALLKHAILVTTLSAPFLAALPDSKRQSFFSASTRRRSRFASLFAKQQLQPPPASTSSSIFTDSTDSLPAPLPRHAHIVHVLPSSPHKATPPSALNPARRSVSSSAPLPPRPKLAQSIEQFLLSFAYPPSASASAPSLASLSAPSLPPVPPLPPHPPPAHRAAPARSSPLASPAGSLRNVHSTASAKRHPAAAARLAVPGPATLPAVPYLVPQGLLGAVPQGSTRCLAEMLLCGMLDRVAMGAEVVGGSGGGGVGWPRAWIGSKTEVLVPVLAKEESESSRADSQSLQKNDKSTRKGRRTRRNEAGLPTPPESSSSDDDDGVPDSPAPHNADASLSPSRSASAFPAPAPARETSAPDDDAASGYEEEEDEEEGTQDTHASRASAPPGTRSPFGRAAPRWGREKAQSEAHVQLGAGHGAGGGGGGGAECGDGKRGKGKGKVLGEKVYRFLGGGFGRFVKGVRGRGTRAVKE